VPSTAVRPGRLQAVCARLARRPGTVEAAPANPDSIADHGIDDVTGHYAKIIDTLPARPILIGHSFGGMIAEKLLGMDYGAAAIGIVAPYCDCPGSNGRMNVRW
jgi:pimeloyl-ACP methyl ester carboxylesterase